MTAPDITPETIRPPWADNTGKSATVQIIWHNWLLRLLIEVELGIFGSGMHIVNEARRLSRFYVEGRAHVAE